LRNSKSGFATRAIHFGYDARTAHGAITPPLYLTSTYAFEKTDDLREIFAGEASGFTYGRVSNPTQDLLQRRLAELEGAEAAVATASGMGAITAALWSFLRPGDEIITDKTLYGCTFAFLQHGIGQFGVIVKMVDLTRPEALTAALTDRTRVVFFETPANPNMRLIDIAAVSSIAKAAGARVIVDNTYCTPYLQRPIELEADMVVHSMTKYLGGHGDLLAGAVVGTAADMEQVLFYGVKDMTGSVISPFTAFLVLRGLKTLQIRMDRHCSSAQRVAEFLSAHSAVASVSYPGLPDFAQRDLALRQMRGAGGVIAFELTGGLDAGTRMMDRVRMIGRAVSLGDAETLIQHPATMTHATYTPEEREEHLITDGLVRLSVGLEDVEDIIADLAQALDD
jgi:methionine-gamma-lyase